MLDSATVSSGKFMNYLKFYLIKWWGISVDYRVE